MMRSLFVPALAVALVAAPLTAHAQTTLDPTAQALLATSTSGGSTAVASASPVSDAVAPYDTPAAPSQTAQTITPVSAATTPYDTQAAQTASPYNGNGASGFGGTLGNGSLTVSSTQTSATDGTLTFQFNPGTSFTGNSVIIYIDSKTGGIADTSNLSDTGDTGREGISGEQPGGNANIDNGNPSRTQVNFASGFGADYAISFENTNFNGVFSLPTDNSSLTYITGQGANSGTNGADIVSVSYSQLGLVPGGSFNFVGTLIDGTSAYRSNETIGDSTTTVGVSGGNGNAGFTGTQTFISYDTYTTDGPAAAPEPGGIVPLLMGTLALGGLILKRRRTAS